MSTEAATPYITVAPNPHRVVVRFAGVTVADSRKALTLREGSYPPTSYVPRADVDMSLLTRTNHTSRCPHKGEANYYTIDAGGQTAVNAIWTYETPFPQVAAIAEYVAFYPNRVDAIAETD